MRNKKTMITAAVILTAGLLAGCAMPRTAQEFRDNAAHSAFEKTKHFVVDRPFVKVARTFRVEAGRCLDKRVDIDTMTGESPYGPIRSRYVDTYYPRVQVLATRAELALQMREDGSGVINLSGMPKHGYYLLVGAAAAGSGEWRQAIL